MSCENCSLAYDEGFATAMLHSQKIRALTDALEAAEQTRATHKQVYLGTHQKVANEQGGSALESVTADDCRCRIEELLSNVFGYQCDAYKEAGYLRDWWVSLGGSWKEPKPVRQDYP